VKYLAVPGHPLGDLQQLAVGADGALWFTETTTPAIGRIDSQAHVSTFLMPSAAGEPIAITPGPDGNIWFSFYGPPQGLGRLTMSGKMTTFPQSYPGGRIWGMTAGPDRNIWFTDWDANLVGRMTTSGKPTLYQLKEMGGPNGITIGPDGALWIAEQGALSGSQQTPGRILRMALDGRLLSSFPLSPRSWQTAPVNITSGADGNLWFTEGEQTGHPWNIERITLHGAITKFWLGRNDIGFSGLALGSDGNMWITEGEKKLARVTPNGDVTEFFIPKPGSNEAQPRGIVSGPLGDLWFVETTAGSIGQFNPH
ncbi:MAG: hypothetical protein JO043_03025, partial [Candidatus Eremiobacteraeota bacterium]|nr:hypothetical protein [Candidatus Eremiobacteraeota bacterium]